MNLVVLLLVGLAVLVPIAGFMGLLTSMASDGCMANACNADLMSVGIFTSALSPAVVFLAAFVLSFGDAATMTARLHPSPSEAGLYALLNAAFVPNATLFSGSWLLGPGFAVGGATLVSPSAVVLGPLPVVPLLAALPAVAAEQRGS